MHTSVNGAKSPEMRVGLDGGFWDTCMAPEPFLHLQWGLVTGIHHGDKMHVWGHV